MTAEHTHRALLSISTGELGSYQFRIEYELKRLLTYASTFQAIVLIDEADVFLEARKSGPSDALEQNAMVAGKCHVNSPLYLLSLRVPVFLRQLEYFQGIIFLTSNRVSVFDQAIKSRIHLALQYASPDKSVRRTLWKKHLATVPAEDIDLNIEEALDAVEDTEMNGREISNSITTARTLAKSEGSKLKLEYLQTIIQVWTEFEDNLKLIQKPKVFANGIL
jgi:SpoVK/Ycf46/Vps4 family AAA+-type ATPase